MSNGDTPKLVKPKSLAQVWRAYSHLILDRMQAGAVQRQETRRAFYAGASAVVTILTANISQSEDEPTEADYGLMDSIVEELNSFSEAVQHRRA